MEPTTANTGAAAHPGAWLLAPRTALTLQPASPGLLKVWDGGLWATFDGPHDGPANDRGDRLLQPGDALTLRAGERLVIERLHAQQPARFTWDPLPEAVPDAPPARAAATSTKENTMRRFRNSPAFSFLGWCAPAPLARLLLALAACGLTATLWLGAAAASSEHRLDASVTPAAPQQQEVRTAGCAAPPVGRAPA